MLRQTRCVAARYQAVAAAYQSRFQWRHREFDPWRRLMDASCFIVDWQTRPRAATLSQIGGHWAHVVTCAHVIAPWDYPNFYPPHGHTRFVSKLTMSDTQAQLKIPSLQGDTVYRHFLSQHHTFVHTNPKLDLAVCHSEQNFRRSGESKLMWLQNEGFHVRPRLELLEELQEGDYVWIYGMTARGDVYDEAEAADPLMIPTGVRARVKHLEADHFFLDTTIDELHGDIAMGMCGSPVMRDGRCVGMLTATVHEESENEKLRGTAMCTYAHDIRAFLVEVEQQMKNMPLPVEPEPTIFAQRRRDEDVADGKKPQEYKDWDADRGRLATHVSVPLSQWKQQETWTSEEDQMNQAVFGRSGPFNNEVQETAFGLNMNESDKSGSDVKGHGSTNADGSKTVDTGDREDTSPRNYFIKDDEFVRMSEWDTTAGRMTRQGMKDATDEGASPDDIDKLRRSIENLNRRKEQERAKQQTMETMQAFRKEKLERDYTQAPDDSTKKRHDQKRRPFDDADLGLENIWGRH